MSPLVGASASQSLVISRNLARRGGILLSFEYRGHKNSTGIFDLDTTVVDTHHAILWASNFARERGLPMHGFTTCYGLVTMLAAQFKKSQAKNRTSSEESLPSPFWSLNAVSGLFSLDRIIRFEDFTPIFGRKLGIPLNRETFLQGIDNEIFDWEGDTFRDALLEFLQGLFEGVNMGRDFFAELPYDRANIPKTLKQLLQANYLDDIYVPPEIPCNFFYGRRDDVLALNTPKGRESYCNIAKSLIPHAIMHEREIDHAGFGPDRNPIVDQVADLFEEAESRAVQLKIHCHDEMVPKKFLIENAQQEIG